MEPTHNTKLGITEIVILSLLASIAFWLVGLEQIFWIFCIPFLTLFVFKSDAQQKPNAFFSLCLFLILSYLLCQLLSIQNIDNRMRFFTFGRNWLINAAGFLFFLALIKKPIPQQKVDQTLAVFALLGGLVGALGLIAELTLTTDIRFETLLRYFIPESLKEVPSVSIQFRKSLGSFEAWFGTFVLRGTSVFSHSTSHALALLMVLPIQAYVFLREKQKKRRILIALLFLITCIDFAFTLTRTAWIALFAATVLVTFYRIIHHFKFLILAKRVFKALIGITIAIIFMLYLPRVVQQSTMTLNQSVITLLPNNKLIFARGTGSAEDRMRIYSETIDQFKEHPWIGWGTQRKSIDGLTYSAGSHSTYLGILYKHGLLGFGFYLLLILMILNSFGERATGNHPPARSLLAYIALVGLIASLIHQFGEELDLDSITFNWFWIATGLCIAAYPAEERTLNPAKDK